MAEWLRVAGRERASGSRKRAACLDYSDSIVLSAKAERDPKGFIRATLKARS